MFSVFGLCFLLYYLKLSSGSGFWTKSYEQLNSDTCTDGEYYFQKAMSMLIIQLVISTMRRLTYFRFLNVQYQYVSEQTNVMKQPKPFPCMSPCKTTIN